MVYKDLHADRLSAVFSALADPTRRKMLERAGLIARGRDAQRRPCILRAAPLRDASDWVEKYRRFWEESLDRLDVYLRELQEKEK